MKWSLTFCVSAFLILFISAVSYSQDDVDTNYLKSNIAFSNFKILGVSQIQYAKCVECINYYDPQKKMKLVNMQNMDFADDGQDYDLVADDGILTSKKAFAYLKGQTMVPIGTYIELSEKYTVVDYSFAHFQTGERGGPFINCRFKWVPCHEMSGGRRALCYYFGWPWGTFEVIECTTGWQF